MLVQSEPIDFEVRALSAQPIPEKWSLGIPVNAWPAAPNLTVGVLTSNWMRCYKWREMTATIVIAGSTALAGTLAIQATDWTCPFLDSNDIVPTGFANIPN